LNGTVPTWKAPYDDATKRGEMGIGAFYDLLGGNVLANAKYNYTPEKLAFKAKVTDGVKTITDPLGPAVLQSKAKYDAILKTLQDTYYIKAITGEVDTDKGFDDFKAQWLKSGGQEVTDEANKVYADRNKK
jgi:putative aldouronate transport system substrate-binding protein